MGLNYDIYIYVDGFLAGFEWGLSGNSLDLQSNYGI
jgi:hypothetical protein